ncbi:hypothetical protein ACFQJC_02365 [Haloferax namakaokahaiae]|uniref:Uncharacterized protein n=1 Tax=Haloferax namakaokahaiae TaxID=1748331 RepID=A0ABD5ZBD0_9EURY
MDLQTDGPVFIPVPGGHISKVATFYEHQFIVDYQLYLYQCRLPQPNNGRIKELFKQLSESKIVSSHIDSGHYVIHQSNGSWVGSGIDEFHEQLQNQVERYESVPEDFALERYKNESAIYIQLLGTGDYLVINANPWKPTRTRGSAAHRDFRHFEIRLILDGLPLNDGRLDEFFARTGLEFGTGKPWNPTTQMLSGKSISSVTVDVKDCIEGRDGYIDQVICENPLYQKDEFLSRLFPNRANIVSGYKYAIASCEFTQRKADTARVNRISVTDYGQLGRDTTQNISLDVTLQY